jgi:hypothetical protein
LQGFKSFSAEWWKWLDSIPEDRNPAADATGAFCAPPVDTPGVKTEEDMRKCTKEDQDKVNLVSVTVDGVDYYY